MKVSFMDSVVVMIISGFIIAIGNMVGYKVDIMASVPGLVYLFLIILAGVAMTKIIPWKVPSIAYITLIGILVTIPAFPYSKIIVDATGKINLLATATPVLAYAGIALGKDMATLRKMGWKIVVVSIFVFTGTFVGSAVIAHFILKMQGLI